MRRILPVVVFIFSLMLAHPAAAFSNETKLGDSLQEGRAELLFKEFRCLVCKGESLAESNAKLAVDMRGLIRQQITAGKDDAQIQDYLVSRYGDVILQEPPFIPETYPLWLLPLGMLVIGAALILRSTRVPKFFRKRKNAKKN